MVIHKKERTVNRIVDGMSDTFETPAYYLNLFTTHSECQVKQWYDRSTKLFNPP